MTSKLQICSVRLAETLATAVSHSGSRRFRPTPEIHAVANQWPPTPFPEAPTPVSQSTTRILGPLSAPPAGIYIHLPFCATKCNYCDFATAPFDQELARRYLHALLREIDCAQSDAQIRRVDSVYFGGGTPSVVDPHFIEAILNALARRFSTGDTAEISLEMNPSSEEARRISFYRTLGVNRLSIGAQSFNDRELASMTRAHTSAEAATAVEHAFDSGFQNISLDLMLGLPGQTVQSFSQSLEKAVNLPVQHLSIYILELHSGTPLHGSVASRQVRLPPEDFVADQYRSMAPFLESRGLVQYEISNFARAGFQSTHNLKYWTRQPYIGFGVSSHSFDGSKRWSNTRSLPRYLDQVETLSSARETEVQVSDADALREQLFLGLRLRQGIPEETVDRFLEEAGARQRWDSFIDQGWVERWSGCYRFSVKGYLVSNSILSELI